ncbi:MAG TPA: ABC transporter permease [Thermoanaerobaculia bacterium]|nr:ABC transporter permease [Thermoanaerobaculia bacterium]
MSGFLLRRAAASLLLLLLVLTATFLLLHLIPGDPLQLLEDKRLTLAQRQQLRHLYGFDRPLPEQYAAWIAAVVVHGDWGSSIAQQRPVTAVLGETVAPTMLLAGAALAIQLGGGLLLGVAAARRRGALTDHLIRIVSLLLYSQPTFWLALMAILLFCFKWPLLPASHMHAVGAEELGAAARLLDLGRHLLLPALVLGLPLAGYTARFVRGSLLEAMGQDYIRTARAKGLTERRVVWVHGLRTAAVPVVQLLGVSVPGLLSGAVITEVIFSWPGIGRLTFDAILARDIPVVLAATALSGALVVAGNFLADVAHAVADPRVRDA